MMIQGLTSLCRQSLVENLVRLSQTAPSVHIDIPPEVTTYVESSRNPDVFTREFVELVQRMNQMLKGRSEAYRLMRDTLAKDIMSAIPALHDHVVQVVESTGDTIAT
jgi:mediator of RNA polymerase II transcription subunit 10